MFVDKHGADTWKDQFAWTRQYTKPGTDLYYNDFAQFDERWIGVLEEFIATGADGKATVRGFYGDYDITVNANGKTKTVMAAYHKGYNNILEITVE